MRAPSRGALLTSQGCPRQQDCMSIAARAGCRFVRSDLVQTLHSPSRGMSMELGAAITVIVRPSRSTGADSADRQHLRHPRLDDHVHHRRDDRCRPLQLGPSRRPSGAFPPACSLPQINWRAIAFIYVGWIRASARARAELTFQVTIPIVGTWTTASASSDPHRHCCRLPIRLHCALSCVQRTCWRWLT